MTDAREERNLYSDNDEDEYEEEVSDDGEDEDVEEITRRQLMEMGIDLDFFKNSTYYNKFLLFTAHIHKYFIFI